MTVWKWRRERLGVIDPPLCCSPRHDQVAAQLVSTRDFGFEEAYVQMRSVAQNEIVFQ
jgi:hypothetical protein